MTSPPTDISVGFVSLGCAKNLVDSQVMAGVLQTEGISLAPSPEEADIVLINTCAFIEAAREESIDTILQTCGLKQSGTCRGVVVAGCMTQRYREELQESLPEVDAFLGLDELEDIGRVVKSVAGGAAGILATSDTAERLYEPRLPGLIFTGGAFAYLKIAEGCNHACAFCAIPAIRGRYRSRSQDDLLREAESLLQAGVRELVLISQDITAYGRDRTDGASLPALLRALAGIAGDAWIRLLYGYPTGVTDELLHVMAETPQVCRYLDIPIQHSHPDVLKAMRRADTSDAVAAFPERARAVMPDIALRTTCLVGFPGEQVSHFKHLCRFVEDARFDHLGVFTYSPEDGTHGATLANRPARRTAARRADRLMAVQKPIAIARNRARVGQPDRILVEKPLGVDDKGLPLWQGRSCREAPDVDGIVVVSGLRDDEGIASTVPVRYVDTLDYDMEAIRDGA